MTQNGRVRFIGPSDLSDKSKLTFSYLHIESRQNHKAIEMSRRRYNKVSHRIFPFPPNVIISIYVCIRIFTYYIH